MRAALRKEEANQEDEDNADGSYPSKRPYLMRNAASARERFHNTGGQMQAPSGFPGFGSRPAMEDDDYESDRDRSRSKKAF